MKVVQVPDSRLRVKTKAVKKITPQLIYITEEMIKLTKTFADPEGVGLAATQIGEDEQYFIMKQKERFNTVFNPRILWYSKKTKKHFEGCLSIPVYWGEVTRPTSVKVSYLDKNGQQVIATLNNLSAWIFQHEYDHLQGKLFVDLVLEQKSKLYKIIGKDRMGEDVFEEVRL